jgi:hypothetical protein
VEIRKTVESIRKPEAIPVIFAGKEPDFLKIL